MKTSLFRFFNVYFIRTKTRCLYSVLPLFSDSLVSFCGPEIGKSWEWLIQYTSTKKPSLGSAFKFKASLFWSLRGFYSYYNTALVNHNYISLAMGQKSQIPGWNVTLLLWFYHYLLQWLSSCTAIPTEYLNYFFIHRFQNTLSKRFWRRSIGSCRRATIKRENYSERVKAIS